MKKIQNITIGKQSISGRLEYFRQQVEECEKDIPEEFWCEECKEKNKKVNHLLDVLKLKVVNKIKETAREIENYPNFDDCFGYGDVYKSPKFICEKCRKLYYSALFNLVKDPVCSDCGGTLIKIEINGNAQ